MLGGLGERLRPLTLKIPKPLLPIGNRPHLERLIQKLRADGFREIVLCLGYAARAFRSLRGKGISFSVEPRPLGTAGALAFAARGKNPGPALVLNGDVVFDFDLRKLERFHRRAPSAATLALVRVQNPGSFGWVKLSSGGKIVRFVEKSEKASAPSLVNAGIYRFEAEAWAYLQKHRSLEREVFPHLARAGKLRGFIASGYWNDFGTIARYLDAHRALLPKFCKGGSVCLAPAARLGRGVRVNGFLAAGAGARVGRGASLTDCVLLAGAAVGARAKLVRCVLAPGARVEADAEAQDCAFGSGTALSQFSRAGVK